MEKKKLKKQLSIIREKTVSFLKAKGFYLVLMGCIALVGVAAALVFTIPKSEIDPAPPRRAARFPNLMMNALMLCARPK